MKISTLGSGSLLLLSILASSACTDNDKKIEEVVVAQPAPEAHEFTVDKKSGKVEFKAEIVYFEFDDTTLTSQGIDRLNSLAAYMDKNQSLKVKVEGHCDERGSAEYNLALGQRRAESVRKFLTSAGIKKDRLLAISFGEERLANGERGESAHAENRRVEFILDGFKALAKQDNQARKIKRTTVREELRNPNILPASD